MHYAAHNTYADLRNGNHGFLNSWAVSRFETRAQRDAFVDRKANQKAKPVTRKQAESIWRSTYLCVGESIPRGGLFARFPYPGGWDESDHFWNESDFEELMAD